MSDKKTVTKFLVNKPKLNLPDIKQTKPKFWGLGAAPGQKLSVFLALIPFLIIISAYLYMSNERHKENPDDKILPTVTQMKESMTQLAFEKDARSDKYILLNDTLSSLKRLGLGLFFATLVGLLVGLNMGLFKGMDAIANPMIRFLSIIPPLALLPILFIVFGVDELAKVVLIFVGTCPIIIRSVYEDTVKIPVEQKTKALTLGASQLQLVYQIILPQIMPRLIDAVRLCCGGAWLFLISAEAIASTDGLGYRIFLVRRYLAMDIIIPYALWITFLGFLNDYILRKIIEIKYSWYSANK
jgi:NitT/TauT family transport system permease protein